MQHTRKGLLQCLQSVQDFEIQGVFVVQVRQKACNVFRSPAPNAHSATSRHVKSVGKWATKARSALATKLANAGTTAEHTPAQEPRRRRRSEIIGTIHYPSFATEEYTLLTTQQLQNNTHTQTLHSRLSVACSVKNLR